METYSIIFIWSVSIIIMIQLVLWTHLYVRQAKVEIEEDEKLTRKNNG